MFLDPESDSNPVYQSPNLVWFNQVAFQGGSDAEPYYLDDVRIVAEITTPIPALSNYGLIGLICLFSLMIYSLSTRVGAAKRSHRSINHPS